MIKIQLIVLLNKGIIFPSFIIKVLLESVSPFAPNINTNTIATAFKSNFLTE